MIELLPQLLALSNPTTSRRERDGASAALKQALENEGGHFAQKYRNLLHSRADFDDAVSHVLIRASRGSQRFRGERGEESARAWVDTVMRHFLIDVDRRRATARKKEEEYKRWLAVQAQQEEDRRHRTEMITSLVNRVVAIVQRHLLQDRDGHKRLRRIRIGLEAIWRPDSDTRSQLLRYDYIAEDDIADKERFRKGRNRLYTDRRRGRVELAMVLASLVRSGQLSEAEALAFSAANCVPWPAPKTLTEVV